MKPPQGQLRELAGLSARIGADSTLVQGGGGNTSLKADGWLWVKASGTWLAHALDEEIFVPLPLEEARLALIHGDDQRLSSLGKHGSLRPSIETSLHALLPQPVVLHVHSVNAIAWAVRQNGQQAVSERLQGLSWAWVPYCRPGLPLTRAIRTVLGAGTPIPAVLVLANHGLVVVGDSCRAAEKQLDEVERRLSLPERPVPRCDPARLEAANDAGWRLPSTAAMNGVGTDPVTLEIARRGPLYPDHVVFLGVRAPVVTPERSVSQVIAEANAAGTKAPVYAAVSGAGVLVVPTITAGAEAMLECLSLVGRRLPSPEGLVFLDPDEVAALDHWEAEAYRRRLDKPTKRA